MRIQYALSTSLFAMACLVGGAGAEESEQSSAARDHTEVGVLTCEQVGRRLNLIIRSTATISCRFEDTQGNVERYKGETGVGFGIDLQWKEKEKLAFTVFAAVDADADEDALIGKYYGATASVAVGGGVGVVALVGGSSNQISLVPVGLSGSTGLGAAAGVTYLYLESADDKDDSGDSG